MAKKKTAKKSTTRASRRVPGSMSDRINTLEVGQGVAVSERIPFATPYGGGDVREALTKMRSAMGAYVARITEELDARSFVIESGSYLTDSKEAVIACVSVTRMA
jgi:hypothetical protein